MSAEIVLAGQEALSEAGQILSRVLDTAEDEIKAVAGNFQALAAHVGEILEDAAAILACIEDERASSVVRSAQSIGEATRSFAQRRLQAAETVLDVVAAEAALLQKLWHNTRAQRSIARETETLAVLTNIEVARLGALGAGFKYLARELASFSESVATDTRTLAAHAEASVKTLEETRRVLAGELPRMRTEFARMEQDMGGALAGMEAEFTGLSRAPAEFKGCIAEMAAQIAGVIAAVQAQDITRQQMEHVRAALLLIENGLRSARCERAEGTGNMPLFAAGLKIQEAQLRNIRSTAIAWVAQIAACLEGIRNIGCGEITSIAPAVLERERLLSAQLSNVARLEHECREDNDHVKLTLEGLANLMTLVGEHQERSRAVRERLQILSFNSIIEASHLGAEADAILEISQNIKHISAEWTQITDRSGRVTAEILGLAERAQNANGALSAESDTALRDATRGQMEQMRTVAACATERSARVEQVSARMACEIGTASQTAERLATCFAAIDTVLEKMGPASLELQGAREDCDRAEAEGIFSAGFTTEIERQVLRAVLYGGPPPDVSPTGQGNDVELF